MEGLRRDQITWVSYAAAGCVGFLLSGLGAALPLLQEDLDATRERVALLPTLLAVGLVLVALAGGWVPVRLRRPGTFHAGFACLGAGAMLLATAYSPAVSSVGAILMGGGAGLLLMIVPAILSEHHGAFGAGALAEATAAYSGTAVLAPVLVGVSSSLGADWRAGFLPLPLITLLGLLAVTWSNPVSPAIAVAKEVRSQPVDEEATLESDAPFAHRWLDIVFVVSIEFCIVFWSSDYLLNVVGLGPAAAAVVAALFLFGMAIGRVAGGQAADRLARPDVALLGATLTTGVGFFVFWLTLAPALAAAGLLLTGLGASLLYPLALSRALAAMADAERASAHAAVAAGLAVAAGPFLLAALATHVGLRVAFLLVPVLLSALVVNAAVQSRHHPSSRTI